MKSVFLLLLLFWIGTSCGEDDLQEYIAEEDRIQGYKARNHTWPLEDKSYVPNTPGWRRLMGRRFLQLEDMEDAYHRFEGFYQTMASAFSAPNFTEHGFALARCPDDLLETLQQAIYDGLPTAEEEEYDAVIPAPERPLFIIRDDLTDRVLHEMHPFVEAWAGIPLVDHQAYGFRLYRNESRLHMHVDKIQTHVISFILHIDSSEDADPWPIFIESFDGMTQEVVLTPGDVLFYESSKCFHGRPRPFRGSWYTSVFAHYYPSGNWAEINHEEENTYAIPLHWSRNPTWPQRRHQLSMIETSFSEPNCPDGWCATREAIKWTGPAEKDFLISSGGKVPFHPQRMNDEL